MIRALIFDFDGLIVDTETPDFESWADLYRNHGRQLEHARWITGVGTHGGFDAAIELAAQLGGTPDANALREQFARSYGERLQRAELLPGVRDLLAAAKVAGIPAAVASSSNSAWVEGWLAHHSIRDQFACVRTRDDVAHVKPAPDLFLSAAACLDVTPSDCLVFEDSPNGMRAAAAAGMRCVAVPIGINQGVELPPTALRVPSLAALSLGEILERVHGHG